MKNKVINNFFLMKHNQKGSICSSLIIGYYFELVKSGWLSSCSSCCRRSTCMDFQFRCLLMMVRTEIGSSGDCGPSTSYYLLQYMVSYCLCITQNGERDYLVCYFSLWSFVQVRNILAVYDDYFFYLQKSSDLTTPYSVYLVYVIYSLFLFFCTSLTFIDSFYFTVSCYMIAFLFCSKTSFLQVCYHHVLLKCDSISSLSFADWTWCFIWSLVIYKLVMLGWCFYILQLSFVW